jgi:hypothetical protein
MVRRHRNRRDVRLQEPRPLLITSPFGQRFDPGRNHIREFNAPYGQRARRRDSANYHATMEASNSSASSSRPAGRGDSFVTRCCGRVPSTRLGMSSDE